MKEQAFIEDIKKTLHQLKEDKDILHEKFNAGTINRNAYYMEQTSISSSIRTLEAVLRTAKKFDISEDVKNIQHAPDIKVGMIIEYTNFMMHPTTRFGIVKEVLYIQDHVDKNLTGTYCYIVADSDKTLNTVKVMSSDIVKVYQEIQIDLSKKEED